ncbi:MAG: hypothetical protein U0W40_02220 [Acidimicrobiia bacterium]
MPDETTRAHSAWRWLADRWSFPILPAAALVLSVGALLVFGGGSFVILAAGAAAMLVVGSRARR